MAPTLPRATSRSSLQSSAAICQISTSSGDRPAAAAPLRVWAWGGWVFSVLTPKSTKTPTRVGGAARRLERARMGSRQKHRRRTLDPRQMRGGGAQRCGLACEQRLDEGDAFAEFLGVRLRQADVARAAVPGADAEQRASVRHLIERRDRRRAYGRMARQEIGHAQRDPRPARGERNDRRRHPGVHGVAGRVGDADHGIAVAVGALGKLWAKLGRVRPEEETDLHWECAFNEVTRAEVRITIAASPVAYAAIRTVWTYD